MILSVLAFVATHKKAYARQAATINRSDAKLG